MPVFYETCESAYKNTRRHVVYATLRTTHIMQIVYCSSVTGPAAKRRTDVRRGNGTSVTAGLRKLLVRECKKGYW